MGEDVTQANIAALKIPHANLTVGVLHDVFLRAGDNYEQAVNEMYDRFRRSDAAEVAVRRELRDKGIGIKRG